jgi:microcystin-dependent protein
MPAQQIQKGTTYVNYPGGNSQVTAENLNDHVDSAVLLSGAISEQTTGTPEETDYILAERAGALFKYTLQSLKQMFTTVVDGFLKTSGGTMTGPLLLNTSNPSTSATAASKGYVDATVGASILPGQIVMWGTSTPPAGWLECKGQSTAGYPNLTALFGTNLPDLRGEFVRGWDGIPARGVDPGRGIRSFQGQTIESHAHTYQNANLTIIQESGGLVVNSIQKPTLTYNTASTTAAGSAETRPRNIALMFIVKT